jgi:hypothetical protein
MTSRQINNLLQSYRRKGAELRIDLDGSALLDAPSYLPMELLIGPKRHPADVACASREGSEFGVALRSPYPVSHDDL